MLYFESDYMEGAHEKILSRLIETNMEREGGYGFDKYCESAGEKIREACGCPEADIFFLVGGTQTNKVVIDALLKKYEGAICAETGHIWGHEAGAIEASGHKVITLPHHDGKISSLELEEYLKTFFADANNEHMVRPGMVYISNPTEYGTVYMESELERLRDICREYGLILYMDGARLGYALASSGNLSLAEIASVCDVFYIGGTKVGALCGEAVVFTNVKMPSHFLTTAKQNGALLAKGRLLGVQFDTLFTDGLYLKISRNAVERADELRCILKEKGYRFLLETPTNQIFVILENGAMNALAEKVRFGFWEKYDENHTVVRFATSWATKKEDIEALGALL